MKPSLAAWATGLALALAVVGCGNDGDDEESTPQTVPRGPGNERLSKPPETAKPTEKAEQPFRSAFEDDDTQQGKAAEAEAAKNEAEEEEERDLGAELKSALGSPVSCLQPRTADKAPERITIAVNAQVMGSGGVSRATASSGHLEPAELDCVRRRVEALRLTQPIEDAPRSVSTSVELELKKPATP